MKFFTGIEFLRSIIITSVASLLLGCIYKTAHVLLVALKRLILTPLDVLSALRHRKNKKASQMIKMLEKNTMSAPALNVFEGVIFTLIGVIFIILLYVTLDGVFRFYVFILFASLFILSSNTLGDGAATLFTLLFNRIYALFFLTVYTLMLPPYILVCIAARVGGRLILPIRKRIKILESRSLVKKKIKETEEIFNKISIFIQKTQNTT